MQSRTFGAFIGTVAASILTSTLASGATLIYEYNAANFNGTNIPDSAPAAPVGSAIAPTNGSPAPIVGRGITNASFGAPTYNTGGGFKNGAYFEFEKYGLLFGGNGQSPNFGPGTGYSMEGVFIVRSGATVIENSGLGFGQDQGNENQFITFGNAGGAANGVQNPVSASSASATTGQAIGTNINAIIPRDVFFHIVKVHDPATDMIRFYINGVDLQDVGILDGTYFNADENYGNAGQNGRELRGVAYQYTRYYAGTLSQAEVTALYVAAVPEPASIGLFSLPALAWLGRRRKQAI